MLRRESLELCELELAQAPIDRVEAQVLRGLKTAHGENDEEVITAVARGGAAEGRAPEYADLEVVTDRPRLHAAEPREVGEGPAFRRLRARTSDPLPLRLPASDEPLPVLDSFRSRHHAESRLGGVRGSMRYRQEERRDLAGNRQAA